MLLPIVIGSYLLQWLLTSVGHLFSLANVEICLSCWSALRNTASEAWYDGIRTKWCRQDDLYPHADEIIDSMWDASSWIENEPKSHYCTSDVWQIRCCNKWLDGWHFLCIMEEDLEDKKGFLQLIFHQFWNFHQNRNAAKVWFRFITQHFLRICLSISDQSFMIKNQWLMINDKWLIINDEWSLISDLSFMMKSQWWIVAEHWLTISDYWWMIAD